MNRVLGTLDGFWFPAAPAARLAMLRILIGAYAFWLTATHYDVWVDNGSSSPALFAPVGVVGILDQPLAPAVNDVLIVAALVANVLFMLGWRHRTTGPLFAVLWLWVLAYRQSWSTIDHSMNLAALHVLILGLAPAADALSLDARRRTAAGHVAGGCQYGFPIRLICAVTVIAYLVSGLAKVLGPVGWSWVTGDAIRGHVAADALRNEVLGDAGSPLFYLLYHRVWLFMLLGVGTSVLELGAPLVLLNKRLAPWWALAAFMMHWGIMLVMDVTFRYHLSGMVFASFFDVERLATRLGALRDRWTARPGAEGVPRRAIAWTSMHRGRRRSQG